MGEPIHVESGAFRFDRARMLEKLGRFQLADPADHILAFCRAGVASGAGRLDIRTLGPGAYELLFDGRPIGREELKDPYGNLFGDDDSRRGRFLAAGLLGAFQLGAAGVSVASSPPEGAIELIAKPDLEHAIGTPQEPDERSRVRVWGLKKGLDAAFGAASARCARSRVPISIDGKSLGPPDHESEPEPSVPLDGGGARGRAWRRFSADGTSLAAMSVYGVEAEHVELDLGPAVIGAELDDDRLRLDAGQAKVVRDARFNELKGRLREASRTLLDQAMTGHRQRLRAAGKNLLKDLRLLPTWDAGLGAAPHEPPVTERFGQAVRRLMGERSDEPWTPEHEAILEEARRTRWLRQAAVLWCKGSRDHLGKPSEALKPLWTASVFLDWKARPVSFLELKTSLDHSPALLVSAKPWPGEGGRKLGPVLWLTGDADLRAVKAVFPAADILDALSGNRWR